MRLLFVAAASVTLGFCPLDGGSDEFVGVFAGGQVNKRWYQSFSIPGYSAYEANQRSLKIFGSGEQAPLVAVFHSKGDVTQERGIVKAVDRVSLEVRDGEKGPLQVEIVKCRVQARTPTGGTGLEEVLFITRERQADKIGRLRFPRTGSSAA